MKFIARLAIFFYVVVISIISGFVMLFVTHVFPIAEIDYYLKFTYYDAESRGLVGLVAGIVMALSFLLAKIIFGGEQKERTIAFDNPSGRVSISLSAVEDMVGRMLQRIPEVKETKPHIHATKRGIEIESRLILRGDVNIPEMTAKLQDMVRSKVQDILGVEETVSVRLHVVKMSAQSEKTKPKDDAGEPRERREPTIPFQGYRS